MAIETLEKTIELHNPPIYVLHEIVHNKNVIEYFIKKGVIFIENIELVPNNSTIVFSAHGVSDKIEQIALQKNLTTIDATCPIVKNTHKEIIKNNKNNIHTILIGSKNHPEIIGTSGRIDNENLTIIENIEEASLIKPKKDIRYSYITQTTLSTDDTNSIIQTIKNKIPNIIGQKNGNICYATQNRQNAVKKLIENKIEILLVIGAKNSSNSYKLAETSKKYGISSYLINDQNEIQDEWMQNIKKIGITAGASAPEYIVQNVINKILTTYKQSTIKTIFYKIEKIQFKIPKIN